MSKLTIQDVAREAGVSVATVSRAINGSGSVREETAQKIKRVIDQIGYVPNVSARNLKTDRSMMFAFVISSIANQHFTKMALTIEKIIRAYGYDFLIFSTEDNAEHERAFLHRLLGLNVDGLILNTTNRNDALVAELSQSIPTVLIDRQISAPNFKGDVVISNNISGMISMIQHLLTIGHRKIGIINSSLDVSTGRERFLGFQKAMQAAGIKVDDHYPYRFDSNIFNEEGGVEGCKNLMSLKDRPSAIVVCNNTMAIGAYKYLRSQGFSVPEDVSVISYGNIENCDLYAVAPSYVTLNPSFLGEKAAQFLLERIDSPDRNNREVVFEPLLVLNESTAPL